MYEAILIEMLIELQSLAPTRVEVNSKEAIDKLLNLIDEIHKLRSL
ncbi:hypothetical protein [Priestia megaterium]|nr:hypothetical protein [Priestia megaterium]